MTCRKFLPDVWPRYQPCQQQCAHEFLMKTFEVLLESTSSVVDTFAFHNQVTGESRTVVAFQMVKQLAVGGIDITFKGDRNKQYPPVCIASLSRYEV